MSCLTYGRTPLLEEAVQSFLQQDYHDKEMVIFNSMQGQRLTFSHPQVKVVNHPSRPSTLGETRNLCIEHCTGDYIAILDDDDIILKGYLSWLAAHVGDMDWIRQGSKFTVKRGIVQKMGGAANNQLMFKRSAWEAVGGYPQMDSGEDDVFRKALIQKTKGKTLQCEPREIGFIYRFGHGLYNISSFGRNSDGSKTGLQKCDQKLRARGGGKGGVFELRPHWDCNYFVITRKWLGANGYSH